MPAGPQIVASVALALGFRFIGGWLRIRVLRIDVVIGLQSFGLLEDKICRFVVGT